MIKNLEELRQKRLNWIKANKENNFETGIKRLLTDLYPDNAHFVYELLQNAEDTSASRVQFTLTGEALEFKHDGDRLFDLSDVESITSIGASTKRDDPTSIGKFGVGFKAVFAYTHTPEIHSGEFHFRIHDLVLPEINGVNTPNMGDRETSFTFPFDHPTKRPAQATAEVDRALRALGDNTLLFLTHIRTIEYLLPDGSLGSLERVDHEGGRIEIRARHPDGKDTISHWLRFQKDVAVIDEDGKTKTCRIAIAYSLVEEEDSRKRHPGWKIVPLDLGQVSIYFPADKEASNLRFHIHAPFASTVARDSVRDCEANRQLRDRIAELVVESLADIRDRGMLTMSFLAVLPNPMDILLPFYEPIRKAAVRAFRDESLTPTYLKTHAPAKYLLQAKVSLKELLSNDDIEFLIGYDEKPLQWVSAGAFTGTNIERFMSGLAITNWDVEQFVDLLHQKVSVDIITFSDGESIRYFPNHTDEPDARFMNWLSDKSAEWHQELYALLYSDYSQTTGWKKDAYLEKLKTLQIVRLSSNKYGLGTESFFQSDGVEQDDILPRVDPLTHTTGKKKTQQESAKKFLEEIGVREVGEAEQVEAILKSRYTSANFKPLKKDLKSFIALLEKEPDKASLFTSYWIFRRADGKWGKPDQTFLDQPFIDTGLSAYYNALGKDAKRVALAESYQDCEIDNKKLVKFAQAVGAQTRLEITKTPCYNNPEWSYLSAVGGNRTSTSIDRDYTIDGLEKILTNPSLSTSKLVWQCMCSVRPEHLEAVYRKNQTTGCRKSYSTLVHQLRASAWVPQNNGELVRPAEATRELLPEGFQFDSGWTWLKAIQFGEEAVKKSEVYRQKESNAKALGFESEEEASKWSKVSKLGISPDDMLEKHKNRDLPDKESPNPERRAGKIANESRGMPDKIRENRERTVDPDYSRMQDEARAYLKHQYTKNDGTMYCQICQAPQPVILNGEPHFEAVNCVGGINTHHKQNNLALCPNHAAMYKNGGLTPDAIQRAILECTGQKISMDLAGNETELYFTQQHLEDLRTVLTTLNVSY